ncbi:MAG: rRNA maturation RNase YbeY [Myroides sp.]|nr:rRNA maturation RNase YbeY [Myroides sp.]
MISFFTETKFVLPFKKNSFKKWVKEIALSEGKKVGDINYIFCDDDYLHNINMQYLQHDTLTDIITFDYTEGKTLNSDIYISVERVSENATQFNAVFTDELLRVMAHGVLHLCGYKDKSPEQSKLMREKENEKIKMFHVEH